MTFFALSLTTFAASYNLPTALSSTNDSYIILNSNSSSGLICIIYNSSDWTPVVETTYKSSAVPYTHSIKWIKNRDSAYARYYSTTYDESSNINGGWGTMQNYTNMTTTIKSTSNETDSITGYMYACSSDIYHTKGHLVFQKPPAPTLGEVTEMSLGEMQQELGRVALIVTLCGVGCLALLIGCHLLRRKLPIWLNR